MVSLQPTMQHNMHLHDDLAALFSRNLTFNPDIQDTIPREPVAAPAPAPAPAQPIVYSISQHYHHSAHIVRQPAQQQQTITEEPQRRLSEPPQSETVSSEGILRNYGVNPANLTPSQLQLFKIADEPQKLRLLELWSICPPNNGGDIPALAWSSTTMEQEEQLAQMRYGRLQQQNNVMSLDGTTVQTSDGKWQQDSDSEPYITSGYEELMRREQQRRDKEQAAKAAYNHFGTSAGPSYSPATDPVYLGSDYSRNQQQQQQQQQLAMASQYGAFEHNRGYGEMDAMDVM
ncbi:hypothetical protein HJFPF1_00942 [Paramyrothecium foliicola]|nr:hypothetical protein HJFPF1_00942 [Paramyrothecium foliicola]